MNFIITACHFAGDPAYRLIFRNFAFFQLSDPDLVEPLTLKYAHVFIAENVAFGQQLLATGPENS